MERRKTYRKEDYLGALRLEKVDHALVDSEKKVISDFIETLAASYCDGLRGVEYALLPAGDFADFLNNHRSNPERLDFRIAADAPTGSTMRGLFVERLEQFVKNYLDRANLPNIQKSGMTWHSSQQLLHNEEPADLVQTGLNGSHSICFEVDADPASRRRPIGIVINNIRARALNDHLKWEKDYRQRSPMLFFDSNFPRKRIRLLETL